MKITYKSNLLATVILVALFTVNCFALGGDKKHGSQDDGGQINTEQEIDGYILHHTKDSHDFNLFSYTDSHGERKHFGFPLPVMLWTSNGFTSFMSSEFHHNDDGHVIVEKNGVKLAKIHGKIFELDNGASSVSFDDHHHATNAHKVFDFSITKSVVGILLIGLLMFLWFSSLARQYKSKKIPTGFGRVLEPLVIYVRDEIARPNIGEKKYRAFTGYLLTVFFFIWISNLAGLMSFGFNITGQIAITACLAIFTLIIYTAKGNKEYWGHVLWMPGVPLFVKPVLAIIELAGHFLIKPFSLLVRLFANINAGHIVVMSLIAIIYKFKESMGFAGSIPLGFVLSFFITLIEVLVAFLQAYIFTMLSALFIGMSVAEHDHH